MFKRKKKVNAVDEKRLGVILKDELGSYLKREELQEALEVIERDKRKKKMWDALPAQKKLKVLRYVLGKKRERNGK